LEFFVEEDTHNIHTFFVDVVGDVLGEEAGEEEGTLGGSEEKGSMTEFKALFIGRFELVPSST